MALPPNLNLAELRRHSWKLSPDTLAEKLSGGQWEGAPHLRYLARRIREAVLKPGGRLIIEMPPRHGKSELASVWSIVWLLSLRPSARVLFASYESSFAEEYGRAVRNLIEEHGSDLGVQVSGDSAAANKWRTTSGGGMWTAGPGSAMTGRGGDLLVIDDPHKNYADAHSATSRENVWNWWLSTARTRLQPGGTVIVIQTRWHEEDLSGRLQKQDEEGIGEGWEVVRMPALAEEDETYELGNGEVWERKEGDALWPEAYNAAYLRQTQVSTSAYLWAGLYQQRPAPPEGGIVKRDWWKYWREAPAAYDEMAISVDTTFKDTDSADFCVFQVWMRAGGEFYLLDQVRDQMSYVAAKRTLRALHHKWPKATRIYIEDTANGPAVISDLEKKVPGLIPISPMGSKENRVHATSGYIQAGNVYIPDPSIAPWVALYVEEWAEFPNGKNDDQVDATTQLLIEWTLRRKDKSKIRGKTAARRNRQKRGAPTGRGQAHVPPDIADQMGLR